MEYGPEQLFAELLTYRRSPLKSTGGFSRLQHNRDLCPMVVGQCELVLGAFRKYRDITYDIQGLRDEGTDVLVRLDEGSNLRLVCFQVKSDEEASIPSLTDKLIVQWQRTVDRYGPELQDYFVLLCWDGEARLDRIRSIHADLAKKQGIVLVHPQLAWSFLHFSGMAIDALARVKVGSEDAVIRAALEMAADLTPTEIALLIALTYSSLYEESAQVSAEELRASSFVVGTYGSTPSVARQWYFYDEDDEDEDDAEDWVDSDNRLAIDLDYLEELSLLFVEGDKYQVVLREVEPLVFLLVDGRLRYDYLDDELMAYVLEAVASEKLKRGTESSLTRQSET